MLLENMKVYLRFCILHSCKSMPLCVWNPQRNLHTPPICMTYSSQLCEIELPFVWHTCRWYIRECGHCNTPQYCSSIQIYCTHRLVSMGRLEYQMQMQSLPAGRSNMLGVNLSVWFFSEGHDLGIRCQCQVSGLIFPKGLRGFLIYMSVSAASSVQKMQITCQIMYTGKI